MKDDDLKLEDPFPEDGGLGGGAGDESFTLGDADGLGGEGISGDQIRPIEELDGHDGLDDGLSLNDGLSLDDEGDAVDAVDRLFKGDTGNDGTVEEHEPQDEVDTPLLSGPPDASEASPAEEAARKRKALLMLGAGLMAVGGFSYYLFGAQLQALVFGSDAPPAASRRLPPSPLVQSEPQDFMRLPQQEPAQIQAMSLPAPASAPVPSAASSPETGEPPFKVTNLSGGNEVMPLPAPEAGQISPKLRQVLERLEDRTDQLRTDVDGLTQRVNALEDRVSVFEAAPGVGVVNAVAEVSPMDESIAGRHYVTVPTRLRAEPSLTAEVLGVMQPGWVEVQGRLTNVEWYRGAPWYRVRASSGREGFAWSGTMLDEREYQLARRLQGGTEAATASVRKAASSSAVAALKSRPRWDLRACVEGRAWIQDVQGRIVEVTVGSTLDGWGRVVDITRDPSTATGWVVVTERGRIS